MKVYRLKHKEYTGEVIFGLPELYLSTAGEKKINELVRKYKPWTHAIPYYKNSKFAFVSYDALMTFLFHYTDMVEGEFDDIRQHFDIEEFNLTTWSAGLSKFLCTYFDDEIEEGTVVNVDMKEFKDPKPYNIVYQDPVPPSDISFIKESYYSKVKTYYF